MYKHKSPGKPAFKFRLLWFVLLFGATSIVFAPHLSALGTLALQSDRYTHTVVVPAISVGLLIFERRRIFANVEFNPILGLTLIGCAMLILGGGHLWFPSTVTSTGTLSVLLMVIAWTGCFLFVFGRKAYVSALFPMLLLFLMVPPPAEVMTAAVSALQEASAGAVSLIFKLMPAPVFRDGMRFTLPGVEIEVAQECSGIRSSTALLIAMLLASHLFLRTISRKVLFLLCAVPFAILKNAIRIVTLSLLGAYVSPQFLLGPIHHRGGVLFALPVLALVLPVLFALQRSENGTHLPMTSSQGKHR
jgi:exosortase